MPSRREVVLMLLLAGMEMTAGFAVVVGSSLLDAVSAQYGMYWLLLAAAVAGVITAILVRAYGPGEPWNRLLLLLGALVGAALPAALVSHNLVSFTFALFLLLVAYWRGIVVTQDHPTHDEVLRRFGIGLGLLFLGLIWVVARGIDSQHSVWQMLAFLGIAYTILTFIALVTARVERTREPGSSQAIVLAVAVQLIVIAALAVVALEIFSYDVVGAMMQHIQPFWDALGATLYHFVTLIASPIQAFIDWLRPPHRTGQGGPVTVQPVPTLEGGSGRPKEKPKGNPVVVIVAVAFAALVLLSILYAIWRAIPRIPRRPPERGFTEERRTISMADMVRILITWFRKLFRHGSEAAVDVVKAGRRRVLGDLPSDPVRRAYVRVLRRAATAGLHREAGTTPLEFNSVLVAAWPEGEDDFTRLTGAYVRRRYGELGLEDSEIDSVREQWQRLRPVMQTPRRRPPVLMAEVEQSEAAPSEQQRRRWRLPKLRDIFRLPEPAMGEQPATWSRSAAEVAFSMVAPVGIIIAILAILAIVSKVAGG